MYKKILTILLATVIMVTMCSCGIIKTGNNGVIDMSPYDDLMNEVKELKEAAGKQYDAGLDFQSEYIYSLALGEISSLRLSIDMVLWLKGEGKNLKEVIGDAPYKTWDEITEACLGSYAPYYFEGLICQFRGRTEQSEDLYKKAGSNPLYEKRDFYFLRKLSVEELYALKKDVAELENEVCKAYTPRSVLLGERTGAEFSPAYHLAMANERSENAEEAAQCALNALITSPLTPSLYANAAAYELTAGNVELAVEILNDGLFFAPEDPSVNYIAALYCHSLGDDVSAKGYLDTAKTGAEGDLLANINSLYEQIGG